MIMKTSGLMIIAVLLLVMTGLAHAATLHGSIYDIELNELNGVVVEVNSEPVQRYLSKDGAYSFELNTGEYELTACYKPDRFQEYATTETIYIKNDGDFVYDLFLFPDFDVNDEGLILDPDLMVVDENIINNVDETAGIKTGIWVVIIILILLIIYYFVSRMKKKSEKKELDELYLAGKQAKKSLREEMEDASMQKKPKNLRVDDVREDNVDPDLKTVLDIIKKEGGRITQKELRKQIPLSEAKISLMISELEHKKIVQKVKKGRGNILILKNK